MNNAQELRRVEVFADLSDDQIRWLGDRARVITLASGEALYHEGDPTDSLFAVLEGELRQRRERGAPDDRWIVSPAGKVTGMLPLSRMTHSPVTVRALVPTRIAAFSSEHFPEMLERIPALHGRLAAVMLDRAREFTLQDEQRQRLVSLGKLSAGLAHELNNPAAAIQRRVDELSQRLLKLSDLAAAGVGDASRTAHLMSLRTLSTLPTDAGATAVDALERSDAQDALNEWLAGRGIQDAWLLADTLVSGGLSVEALETATCDLPPEAVHSAVQWIEADLAAQRLVHEIAEATRRIVDLIAAAKSYSNLDHAVARSPIDVNEGIRSTLAMLKHKVGGKGVVIEWELEPGLPRVTANAGELNQVWTNLVDNALDAVAPGGTIAIRSSSADGVVTVQVDDDGPGIPPDVMRRIFEPFFTTKDVGEGTGLGLDIVRRIVRAHDGEVRVTSAPGQTCFAVYLPESPAERAPAGD